MTGDQEADRWWLNAAIRHRKASLCCKTTHGPEVGDGFVSLIHTAVLNHVAAFDYLVALLMHHKHAEKTPAAWLPWNCKEAVAALVTPVPRLALRQSPTTTGHSSGV
jgi:hypothetical protein